MQDIPFQTRMTATAGDYELLDPLVWRPEHRPYIEAPPELTVPEVKAHWSALYTEIWDRDARLVRVREVLSDVLEKLTSRLTVRRRKERELGTEVWALCPFHADTHVGSFSVQSRTGRYYCFVCGAGGGVVSLMDHFGLWGAGIKREDVTRYLADLKDLVGYRPTGVEEMVDLPEFTLAHLQTHRPLRYLAKGHRRELLDWLGVGVDPRNLRTTFPVRKASGSLVAVQTRTAQGGDDLRWKWYTQELIGLGVDADWIRTWSPPRRTVFWCEDHFLPPLLEGRLRRPLVLVEGLGAAMRSIAAGFPALATFGTQMGPGQLHRLSLALERAGGGQELIICPDGDKAGWDAALHHADALSGVCHVRIAPLRDGTDAEDYDVGALRDVLLRPYSVTELFNRAEGAPYVEAFKRRLTKLEIKNAQVRHTHRTESGRLPLFGASSAW